MNLKIGQKNSESFKLIYEQKISEIENKLEEEIIKPKK